MTANKTPTPTSTADKFFAKKSRMFWSVCFMAQPDVHPAVSHPKPQAHIHCIHFWVHHMDLELHTASLFYTATSCRCRCRRRRRRRRRAVARVALDITHHSSLITHHSSLITHHSSLLKTSHPHPFVLPQTSPRTQSSSLPFLVPCCRRNVCVLHESSVIVVGGQRSKSSNKQRASNDVVVTESTAQLI